MNSTHRPRSKKRHTKPVDSSTFWITKSQEGKTLIPMKDLTNYSMCQLLSELATGFAEVLEKSNLASVKSAETRKVPVGSYTNKEAPNRSCMHKKFLKSYSANLPCHLHEKETYTPTVCFETSMEKCGKSASELEHSSTHFKSVSDKDGPNSEPPAIDSTILPAANESESDPHKKSVASSADMAKSFSSDAVNRSSFQFFTRETDELATASWTTEGYRRARREILDSIKYFYKSSLIIWCPEVDVENEVVCSLLTKRGTMGVFYDRWIYNGAFNSQPKWGGVVAFYSSVYQAKVDAKEIPEKHEILRALELPKLVRCLIRSELKYFKRKGCSRVVVTARLSRTENSHKSLEKLLSEFGPLASYDCQRQGTGNVAVFTASYDWATHAFLARTLLDGLPYDNGALEVDVEISARETILLKELPLQLRKFIGETYFPF